MSGGLTREQAIALFDSGWWEGRDPADIAAFQLFEPLLCMPFGKFQEAVQKALGRPVWRHEFAYADRLKKEFLKERPAPSFEEILGLIPKEKRILLGIGPGL